MNAQPAPQPDPAKVLELAERIKTLWYFITTFIPDKDLLKQAANQASNISGRIATAASVITALGGDYAAEQLEAEVRRKRADALFNLVDVLDVTEKARAEFAEKLKLKAEGRAQLASFMGGSR